VNDKLARMISKVQSLIDAAEATDKTADREQDPESSEGYRKSAANYRATAEAIMRKYRIEEEQLIATDQITAEPVMHSIFGFGMNPEFFGEYSSMMRFIAEHSGIEIVSRYDYEADNPGVWFDLFGYEGDLRMAEWLWSSARLVFGSHLDPQVDPRLSDQENAYNLRQAGILRKDIARKLWQANTPALRSKAQRLYVAECTKRGEKPLLTGLGSDAEMYRESYARGFTSRLHDRLRAARDAADAVGGVVVLAGRAERIKEAKYRAYPRLRPMNADQIAKRQAEMANIPKAPVKVDRRRKDWTQADERAYQRRNGRSAEAGRVAGSAAAGKVEITRNHDQAQRLDTPHTALEG